MSTAAVLLAVALLTAAGPYQLRRRTGRAATPGAARWREHTTVDPLAAASALDVFAVCLSAGMAVSTAAAVTAPSAPDGLQEVLQRAAHLLALGADADAAWSPSESASEPASEPVCESLTRLARRSAVSGAALAQGVTELAEQARQDAAHCAAASAERAGVLIAGPLGLCFLPAFVCLGIVPVVAGLAREVFGGGLL